VFYKAGLTIRSPKALIGFILDNDSNRQIRKRDADRYGLSAAIVLTAAGFATTVLSVIFKSEERVQLPRGYVLTLLREQITGPE